MDKRLGDLRKRVDAEFLVDLLVLVFISIYIMGFFKPSLMFMNSITTGGDTASHYYTAKYLRDSLLTQGDLFGWCPGNYGGFPILQFYFFFPFLLMVLLNCIVSLEVAFKLVTVLGTFLMPYCAYLSMRAMKLEFPIPSFAAIFTLPFLFMEANSMWGGNIPSMLAGEFSYSLSLALTVLFLGLLERGVTSKRFWIWNAILLALIAFTHVYTVIFAVVSSIYLLAIPDKRELSERFRYLFRVYLLSFMLVSFWMIPMVYHLDYTTAYPLRWIIDDLWKITPPILLPFILFSAVGLAYCLIKNDGRIGLFYFSIPVAAILFFISPYIGIVDIRFIPFIQLSFVLTAAYILGKASRGLKGKWVLPIIILLLTTVWVNNSRLLAKDTILEGNGSINELIDKWDGETIPKLLENKYNGYIPSWIRWNYEGFEGKQSWSTFREINDFLEGGFNDSRVVYEHSDKHNTFGSSRAFESLPLFSGRATLEGLYMQSSISAPFVFYIQSEVSKQNSCPFWMNYPCTQRNLNQGTEHLKMFNVGYFIARSDEVKQELRSNPEYRLEKTVGDYEIHQLLTNENRYVILPRNEPVLYRTGDWKTTSYDWFRREELLDIPLVFVDEFHQEDLRYFNQTASELDSLNKTPLRVNCSIMEEIGDYEISFFTSCPGKPHLIRMSYFPNWRVEGAEKIYLVSPSFMLVYPEKNNVRLYYGDTWIDHLGKGLTIIALLFTVYIILVNLSRNQRVRRFFRR
ncbi:MAG: hypothetical protein B6U72_04915 [Candidatus Altiarchaeales archaeon ex4484_2]|nr:MAG: hypothetical protein B6U72_04915 [Candidatus Altiarchaeales archaeon ex4484_2]